MSRSLQDIINGSLLGDGSVFLDRCKYIRYKLTAKDIRYLEWTCKLLKAYKIKCYFTRDKRNNTYILYAPSGVFFQNLRSKWYKKLNGKTIKIVPKDIELTPTILLHWYLGDGSLVRQKGNRIPRIVLATNNFSKEDINFLIEKLKTTGLNFYPLLSFSGFKKGAKCGYVLISKTNNGTPFRFFKLIGMQCPEEIKECFTGNKGRGSKRHYFKGKWPTEEDWLRILSNVQGIGKIIREKRKEFNLTSQKLAELAGTSARHIRHIESGDRYPSVRLFRKVLNMLDVNALYLLEELGRCSTWNTQGSN